MPPKKILIANKYFLMNYAIKCIFQRIKDFDVIGVAEDEVLDKIKELAPNLLVVEMEILHTNSFQLISKLKEEFPSLKIIVLLDLESEDKLHQILSFNLDGYLLKNTTKEELISAAQSVFRDEIYYSKKINEIAVRSMLNPGNGSSKEINLSLREKEVLQLIALGISNDQIAERLFISSNTVLTHRRNIMRKLNVNSSPHLILTAVKKGLISID